jgi:predicted small metal-binding protein
VETAVITGQVRLTGFALPTLSIRDPFLQGDTLRRRQSFHAKSKSGNPISKIALPTKANLPAEGRARLPRAIPQEVAMPKVLRCADVVGDCDFVARGESDQEILQQASEHARSAHDINEITPEVAEKVKAAIREEAA